MKAICLRARGGPEALAYDEAQQPRPREARCSCVHTAGVIQRNSPGSDLTTRAESRARCRSSPDTNLRAIAPWGRGQGRGRGDLVYGLNDWYRDAPRLNTACVAIRLQVGWRRSRPRSRHTNFRLTAWQGLVERAGLGAGHGCRSTRGRGRRHLAVQLTAARAWVTGTASAANVDSAQPGAEEVIDYRAERFEDVVRDVDGLDTVGGRR